MLVLELSAYFLESLYVHFHMVFFWHHNKFMWSDSWKLSPFVIACCHLALLSL